MAGITSVLDIAKQALLTHQLSVQVAANNVANVDTPGYSRQSLALASRRATPTSVGPIGTGVEADTIARQYDAVLTARIIQHNSTLANFEAQENTMAVVETIFNETHGLGLNDLMNKFWQSWQDVANLPDNLAARLALVQGGQLLQDYIHNAYSEVVTARTDIAGELDTAIAEINNLSSQVADLNREIGSLEGPNQTANDLRDKRDGLVGELARFLDISYFENPKNGSVSVILADGHPLVDGIEFNNIDWIDNNLVWINELSGGREVEVTIGAGEKLGGKIGGWLEVYNQLIDGDTTNVFGRLESFTNSLIREINQVHSQGVGMHRFSGSLTGAAVAADTTILSTTIDASLANRVIQDGTITINDQEVGAILGGVATNGLAMTKAFNAVNAINNAQEDVVARLTTQISGGVVVGLAAAEVVTFTVNGISVTYTAAALETPNATATNVVAAINAAIAVNNLDPTIAPDMSIEAVVGDGTNGGVVDSIILRNNRDGENGSIVIAGIDPLDPAEVKLSLTDGTYTADATQNTGEITLFSVREFELTAGPDDTYLVDLGMAGGLHADDLPGDGTLTYSFQNPGGVRAGLMGFNYGDEIITDGGSFDLWLYDAADMPLYPSAINVQLDRAYTLQDVADAINVSVTNTSGGPAWLTAVVTTEGRLELRPATGNQFAFANDTSNILQAAGINTFFAGHDASTIAVDDVILQDSSFIAAGLVDTDGTIFTGDNENVLAIAAVQYDETVQFSNGDITTLDGFYNALVGDIGSRVRTLERNVELHNLLSDQLNDLRDSFSGVSLDEELANLIKFQQAYSAAAKLVSISDEMLDTLVNTLKR